MIGALDTRIFTEKMSYFSPTPKTKPKQNYPVHNPKRELQRAPTSDQIHKPTTSVYQQEMYPRLGNELDERRFENSHSKQSVEDQYVGQYNPSTLKSEFQSDDNYDFTPQNDSSSMLVNSSTLDEGYKGDDERRKRVSVKRTEYMKTMEKPCSILCSGDGASYMSPLMHMMIPVQYTTTLKELKEKGDLENGTIDIPFDDLKREFARQIISLRGEKETTGNVDEYADNEVLLIHKAKVLFSYNKSPFNFIVKSPQFPSTSGLLDDALGCLPLRRSHDKDLFKSFHLSKIGDIVGTEAMAKYLIHITESKLARDLKERENTKDFFNFKNTHPYFAAIVNYQNNFKWPDSKVDIEAVRKSEDVRTGTYTIGRTSHTLFKNTLLKLREQLPLIDDMLTFHFQRTYGPNDYTELKLSREFCDCFDKDGNPIVDAFSEFETRPIECGFMLQLDYKILH